MKPEDLYAGDPALPDNLRAFARDRVPEGITHCLLRALILSAAKEIETWRQHNGFPEVGA